MAAKSGKWQLLLAPTFHFSTYLRHVRCAKSHLKPQYFAAFYWPIWLFSHSIYQCHNIYFLLGVCLLFRSNVKIYNKMFDEKATKIRK